MLSAPMAAQSYSQHPHPLSLSHWERDGVRADVADGDTEDFRSTLFKLAFCLH